MRYVLPALLLAAATPAPAQQADPAVIATHRVAIDKLAWMDGVWRGQATVRTPSGELRLTQTERVGPMLDGTVRVIEGKGYMADGRVGFNAFAVVSFDPRTNAYTFRSYTGGHSGNFPATVEANGYRWETPAGPNAVVRYHARLENGRWRETGERVVQGQAPQQFFDMTLTRVGDTSWPASGGPAAR